jgi:hypothetical protein
MLILMKEALCHGMIPLPLPDYQATLNFHVKDLIETEKTGDTKFPDNPSMMAVSRPLFLSQLRLHQS